MKKLLAWLLAALLIVTLCACGDKNEEKTGPQKENEIIEDKVVDTAGDTFYFESIDSETVKITGFSGSSAPHPVTIPSVINEKMVTEIAEGAFRAASNITVLTLPDTLLKIHSSAFAEASITSVALPASLTDIGARAFAGCAALTTVTFADGIAITAIPDAAFINCGLTAIEIPAGVKLIGNGVFMSNKALAAVKVNEGTELIGNGAFQGCEALSALTLPASVAEIGEYAFSGSNNLYRSGVTVPAGSVAETYIAKMNLAQSAPQETPAE